MAETDNEENGSSGGQHQSEDSPEKSKKKDNANVASAEDELGVPSDGDTPQAGAAHPDNAQTVVSVDTLGLPNDGEAPREGGARPDSASVTVSAITNPTYATIRQDQGNLKGDIILEGGSTRPASAASASASVAVSAITTPTAIRQPQGETTTSMNLKGDIILEGGSSTAASAGSTVTVKIASNSTPSPGTSNSGDKITSTAPSDTSTNSISVDRTASTAPSGSSTQVLTGSNGVTDSTSRPGAYRAYPGTTPSLVDSSQPTDETPSPAIVDPSEQTAGMSEPTLDAEAQEIAAEAYLVQDPDHPAATVVHTYCGIERKRLFIMTGISVAVAAIVLGVSLGVVLPRANKNNGETCGPLCEDGSLPDPQKTVLGFTCTDWDFNSTTLPLTESQNGTCTDSYLLAAYECGCPGVEEPSDGCGELCKDGGEIPDPDLMIKDMYATEYSCADWQLKSKFDTDPDQCPMYNAIGAMCGCENNERHPENCGPLCRDGPGTYLHSDLQTTWNTQCQHWETMSMFLPSSYNNDAGETCDEFYHDVAYQCACPDKYEDPSMTCGTLCQQRRKCETLCEDGSEVPDPDQLVRRETCQAWEMHVRLEPYTIVCPLYHMTGAQCGCDNTPPENACGPLCGTEGDVPDPTKVVYGETCESWDYKSKYLPVNYGEGSYFHADGIIVDCKTHFSGAAYGCGCPGIEPPADGCGPLCADGSTVPDPLMIVNARTCEDLELLSLFEEDKTQCPRYKIFGGMCGCPDESENAEECFMLEHLKNETYYYSAGGSLYHISFGESGYFAQIQNNNDLFMIGHHHGFSESPEGFLASYGGGAQCGLFGPRSGSVSIVEDMMVTEPTVNYVIEPSICVYHAELKVPKMCNMTNGDV